MIDQSVCSKCGNRTWCGRGICHFCCTHDRLEFSRDQDDQGFFYLTAYCIECNYEVGDDKKMMIDRYVAVRKEIAQ